MRRDAPVRRSWTVANTSSGWCHSQRGERSRWTPGKAWERLRVLQEPCALRLLLQGAPQELIPKKPQIALLPLPDISDWVESGGLLKGDQSKKDLGFIYELTNLTCPHIRRTERIFTFGHQTGHSIWDKETTDLSPGPPTCTIINWIF